jgi:hypothetical protein
MRRDPGRSRRPRRAGTINALTLQLNPSPGAFQPLLTSACDVLVTSGLATARIFGQKA